MNSNPIPADLMARIKLRAGDPARRTDFGSLGAKSASLSSLINRTPRTAEAEAQAHIDRLQTMLANVNSMFGDRNGHGPIAMVGPDAGGPGGPLSFGQPEEEFTADEGGCSDAEVEATEAELGFALPDALRQLYLEVGDGGFGPGDGVFSRDDLVAKYREMTEEAVGRCDEPWPLNLLPIAGADWDLVSIDRNTGRIVYFDAEELAEDEPDSWRLAFKPEADSLAAWLAKWVDKPAGGRLDEEARRRLN